MVRITVRGDDEERAMIVVIRGRVFGAVAVLVAGVGVQATPTGEQGDWNPKKE